jgi:hypothetical protein
VGTTRQRGRRRGPALTMAPVARAVFGMEAAGSGPGRGDRPRPARPTGRTTHVRAAALSDLPHPPLPSRFPAPPRQHKQRPGSGRVRNPRRRRHHLRQMARRTDRDPGQSPRAAPRLPSLPGARRQPVLRPRRAWLAGNRRPNGRSPGSRRRPTRATSNGPARAHTPA